MTQVKQLDVPNFHDRYITGLRIENENLIMYIEPSTEITFIDVRYARFDDFRMGNIILDLSVYHLEDMEPFMDELLYLADLDIKQPMQSMYAQKLAEKVKNEKPLLISIESSYGLNGYILCKDIKL